MQALVVFVSPRRCRAVTFSPQPWCWHAWGPVAPPVGCWGRGCLPVLVLRGYTLDLPNSCSEITGGAACWGALPSVSRFWRGEEKGGLAQHPSREAPWGWKLSAEQAGRQLSVCWCRGGRAREEGLQVSERNSRIPVERVAACKLQLLLLPALQTGQESSAWAKVAPKSSRSDGKKK